MLQHLSISNIKKLYGRHGKAGGFVALIMVLLVSAVLLAVVLSNSLSVADLFDEAYHKEYRLLATNAALTCFDQALLEITHDYFYVSSLALGSAPLYYPQWNCSIVSITDPLVAPAYPQKLSAYRTIVASGTSHSSTTPGAINARITAQVVIGSDTISLLSATTTFY